MIRLSSSWKTECLVAFFSSYLFWIFFSIDLVPSNAYYLWICWRHPLRESTRKIAGHGFGWQQRLSRGISSHYKGTSCLGSSPIASGKTVYNTASDTILSCRASIDAFSATIKKYSSCLVAGGPGNRIKDITRKIQWRASQEQESIARFRAQVTGYTESINMLLATAKM